MVPRQGRAGRCHESHEIDCGQEQKSLSARVSLALDGDEHTPAEPEEPSGSLVDVFKSPVTCMRMVLIGFI